MKNKYSLLINPKQSVDNNFFAEQTDAAIIEMNDILIANTLIQTSCDDNLQNQKTIINDISAIPCENLIDISSTNNKNTNTQTSVHICFYKKHAKICFVFVKALSLTFAIMLAVVIVCKFFSMSVFSYTVVINSTYLWQDIVMFLIYIVIYSIINEKRVKLLWTCLCILMLSIIFTISHHLFYYSWNELSYSMFMMQDLSVERKLY